MKPKQGYTYCNLQAGSSFCLRHAGAHPKRQGDSKYTYINSIKDSFGKVMPGPSFSHFLFSVSSPSSENREQKRIGKEEDFH